MRGLKIIGHRGWGPTHNEDLDAIYPENTLIAFDYALSQGADGIEFDILLSKDKIPVIIHDKHLARHVVPEQAASVGSRFVSDFTLSELQLFDFGQGQSLLSLQELLDFAKTDYPNRLLNMDVKDPELVPYILEAIDTSSENNIIVSSYNWDLLRDFRRESDSIKLVPAIKSALLFGQENIRAEDFMPLTDRYLSGAKEKVLGIKQEIGAAAFDCSVMDVKPPLIDWAAECGIGLQISTSNNRVDAANTNYDLLMNLYQLAQKTLPFIICKVDEPSLVKNNLMARLGQGHHRRGMSQALNFY